MRVFPSACAVVVETLLIHITELLIGKPTKRWIHKAPTRHTRYTPISRQQQQYSSSRSARPTTPGGSNSSTGCAVLS